MCLFLSVSFSFPIHGVFTLSFTGSISHLIVVYLDFYQVKEMYRRETSQQEEDIRAKTTIIEDYKTICSQLSKRIEVLQKQHKDQLEQLRVSLPTYYIIFFFNGTAIVLLLFLLYIRRNVFCNKYLEIVQTSLLSDDPSRIHIPDPISSAEIEKLQKHVRDLELELAQTKLKLVEAECKVQVIVLYLCT